MPTDPGMQNEIITWTDSAGNVTNLGWLWNPNDLAVIWGRKGAYMPVPIFAKYKTPFQDGALITFLNYAERQIDLTCEMFCSNITILQQRMTALLQAFRPDKPDGVLSVTNEVGITRQLTCHYVDGLKGVEDIDWGAGYVGRFVIIFEAGSPFWKDPHNAAAQTISVAGGGGGTGAGTTYTSSATITNAGSVDAWPIWTVTIASSGITTNADGAAMAGGTAHTYCTIRNNTTGDYLTFYVNTPYPGGVFFGTNTTVSTDTTRVIDCTPNIDTIRDGSSALVPATMTFQNFFALADGANTIEIDLFVPGRTNVAGSDHTDFSASASVSVVYKPQFLGL